ncbi:MAG: hypothetical protein MUO77_08290 [Anaerolineales bacterium]|nr:hypothetical protein [Anaerolineales bacterium]
MTEISKVRNKWKFLGLAWFGVFIFGWMPVVLPSFSILILKGLIAFSIFISILIIFFWPRLEWYIILLLGEIVSIEFLILSIRSMLLLSPVWAYPLIGIVMLSYICIFFLPKYAPRLSYLIVNGNPESKLEKRIYWLVMGVLGIAGSCGASIGIFGGRIYGWKLLGVIGPIFGLVGVFFGLLGFHNLWQKRPWASNEKGGKA